MGPSTTVFGRGFYSLFRVTDSRTKETPLIPFIQSEYRQPLSKLSIFRSSITRKNRGQSFFWFLTIYCRTIGVPIGCSLTSVAYQRLALLVNILKQLLDINVGNSSGVTWRPHNPSEFNGNSKHEATSLKHFFVKLIIYELFETVVLRNSLYIHMHKLNHANVASQNFVVNAFMSKERDNWSSSTISVGP